MAFADELDRLEELLDAMSEDAHRHRSVFGSLLVSNFRACVAGRRGDLRACEEHIRPAVEVARERELIVPLAIGLWYAAEPGS